MPSAPLSACASQRLTQNFQGCDFLSADYNLNELDQWINSEEWKPKIGRVIILGGVPERVLLFLQALLYFASFRFEI